VPIFSIQWSLDDGRGGLSEHCGNKLPSIIWLLRRGGLIEVGKPLKSPKHLMEIQGSVLFKALTFTL
jgi:hypothetical protein